MSNSRYYQPEIETMSLEEMQALQSEKLVKQVRHIYDNVPYYRAKMERKGVTPDDIHGIEDLHKLPFITKDDLRDQYPKGFLAVDQSEECIVIGGGVAEALGKSLLPVFEASFRDNLFGLNPEDIEIRLSELGDDAVAVGAAILARESSK